MSDIRYMVFPAGALAGYSASGNIALSPFGYHDEGAFTMYLKPEWMGLPSEGVVIVPSSSAPTLEFDDGVGTSGELPILLGRRVNGFPAFLSHNPARAFYRDCTGAWVMVVSFSRGMAPGCAPSARLGLDGTTWTGDGWYEFPAMPTLASGPLQGVPKGTILNDENAVALSVNLRFPRYIKKKGSGLSEFTGEFEPQDDAGTGILLVGFEMYGEKNSAVTWTRRPGEEVWVSSGGEILRKNDSGHFVVGVEGSGRWWRATEKPSRSDGCVLRRYEADDGGSQRALDEERTLSYAGLGGVETVKAHVAEVAVWR